MRLYSRLVRLHCSELLQVVMVHKDIKSSVSLVLRGRSGQGSQVQGRRMEWWRDHLCAHLSRLVQCSAVQYIVVQ